MKVKVTQNAYYNNEYIKAGRVIEFEGKKLPSWATLANGGEGKKGSSQKPQKPNENKEADAGKEQGQTANENQQQENIENENKEAANSQPEDTADEKTVEDVSPEAAEYLERLINEGIDKGILIDDADKKTVKEQIAELEEKLNKKGN